MSTKRHIKQKTATALTITVIKSSSLITLPQTFKRRSTTTKPRLASYTVNGISARANVRHFVDKSKLLDLINNFNIDNAKDFINAIGKCFPQQLEKEEKNPKTNFESKYQLLDFSDFGVKILFRISNHSINCDNIIEDIEETYSIALKSKKSRNTFKPNDLTVTEYVYFTENCNQHRYLLIAEELYRFLETSEWDNSFVPADAINHSPKGKNLKGTTTYTGKGGEKGSSDRGVLYEYFTPDYVCEFMYQLAVKYGYTCGKVLEPSCGSGNCIKPIYERKDYTHIDAFETNAEAANACKERFPHVNIYNNYFETAFLEQPRFSTPAKKTWLPNAPYDLVIGNPPYGKATNRYSSYFKGKDRFAQLEMFFMYKSLELLKSGGLLEFITSINFMSTGSAYQDAKDRIGEIADLVDAYRLPKVFEKTDICTDIIVLRKK